MNKEDIIKAIESCEELTLPNGATGAIQKEELISKIENLEDE